MQVFGLFRAENFLGKLALPCVDFQADAAFWEAPQESTPTIAPLKEQGALRASEQMEHDVEPKVQCDGITSLARVA
jgi:hypothetical protein